MIGLYTNKKLGLLVPFLLMVLVSFSQIGGNEKPLLYSVHTYKVKMDNVSYEADWGLYPANTTKEQIEYGTVDALERDVDYTFSDEFKDETYAYFTIQFNLNIISGGDYVVGYIESTNGDNVCITALALPIHIYPPFDVDVALHPSEDPTACSDQSTVDDLNEIAPQTTVQYLVNVVYPGAIDGGYIEDKEWSFSFQVIVSGNGGSDANIASITATGITTPQTYGLAVGESNFTGSLPVNPSESNPITFTIVYNDVLGVDQNITFLIKDIVGSYSERDVDEIGEGNIDDNDITHVIYGVPNVGSIEAMN